MCWRANRIGWVLVKTKLGGRVRVLFHILGLSCLGSSIFLQVLVFMDIMHQGYFLAVEKNQAILWGEVAFTVFTLVYFLYLYVSTLRSIR